MKWLKEHKGLDAFFEELAGVRERVLVTDYDGTLAPFVFDRDKARPYPDVLTRLRSIIDENNTRLVIVTGRTIEGQRQVMGLDRPVEVWGSHGWERLTADGEYKVWPIADEFAAGLREVDSWATEQGLEHQVEVKPTSVALHWRSATANEREALKKKIDAKLRGVARQSGLELHGFDGGLELRTPGRDKGVVIQTLLEELGDSRKLAYLGDDLTDEDAFSALGGEGLRVLVRPEPRETKADLWLRPPRELLRFFERWQEAARG